MAKVKSDILSSDKNHLAIMYNGDGIVIDKELLKYSAIRKEVEEFNKKNRPSGFAIENTPINMDIDTEELGEAFREDSRIKDITKAEGYEKIKGDDIRSVNIYINEQLSKDVFSTFNEYGTPFISNNVTLDGDLLVAESGEKTKRSFFQRIGDKFKTKFAAKEAEQTYVFDAIQFFSIVKGITKENMGLYVDRIAGYIAALKNCDVAGQQALKEKLIRDMVVNKYESVLYAKGMYYVVTEDQIVNFVKKTEKGVRLTYVKNYMRIIPPDVVEKINETNKLEIFDNYVILHYDPDCLAFSETIQETKKRRDPILFGVIRGSNKLYYITDWIDEYCDLTLDKFVETLQIDKEELKLKENIL